MRTGKITGQLYGSIEEMEETLVLREQALKEAEKKRRKAAKILCKQAKEAIQARLDRDAVALDLQEEKENK